MGTDNYCFCELAPLYALGVLDPAEREWVEQQVAACPELAEELAAYESAVTAIPYGVSSPPLASSLKAQLFERLELELLPPEPAPPSYSALRAQDLDWQPHPTPGVTIAILHRDLAKREIAGLLRAEPGVRYPLHCHAAFEEILMLEGDLVIEEQVYGAGDYIRSAPGSSHAPHTSGGCRFFFHTSMDDEYPEQPLP